MIALLFPIVAMLSVFFLAVRSLGLGLLGVFTVGYFNGVVRANYLSVYTTFMFDASLLGLYAGCLVGRPQVITEILRPPGGTWAMMLVGWPALLTLFPMNDFLVQLVAFRATVWFLPVLLLSTLLRAKDLVVIARGLAGLNILSLAGGIYLYQNGVSAWYPENAITQIIYRSKDVGGGEYYRIPSLFLNAQSYGGAMLFTLPFLLGRTFGREVGILDRVLSAVGVVAAFAGIMLCAARLPVVMLLIAALVTWAISRFHLGIGLVTVGLGAACIVLAGTDERLQRANSLEDTEAISDRVRVSANESFLELMVDYPAGAGMGSSVGTSIPYFLAERAPKAIGLENEYCRLLIDQGVIGLGLWIAFLIWLLSHPPPLRLDCPWGLESLFMFSLVLTNWATAFIGTGTLSSTPGSVLLLTQMGVLIRIREVTKTDSAASPALQDVREATV